MYLIGNEPRKSINSITDKLNSSTLLLWYSITPPGKFINVLIPITDLPRNSFQSYDISNMLLGIISSFAIEPTLAI